MRDLSEPQNAAVRRVTEWASVYRNEILPRGEFEVMNNIHQFFGTGKTGVSAPPLTLADLETLLSILPTPVKTSFTSAENPILVKFRELIGIGTPASRADDWLFYGFWRYPEYSGASREQIVHAGRVLTKLAAQGTLDS